MYVLAGLGNPGPRYRLTRHNVGFMVVDRLAVRWRIPLSWRERTIRVGTGTVAGCAALLVQPGMFMNRSGESLSTLSIDWLQARMVVVHDDLDLAQGQLRVRHDGGAGGHRGVESILDRFGAEFDRVRIGVGRPPVDVDAADFVLQELSGSEMKTIRASTERACDAVETLIRDGLDAAMSRFNTRPVRRDIRTVGSRESE